MMHLMALPAIDDDRTWLDRFIRPSVGAGVASDAPCPVPTVRPDPTNDR
jgi:nucleotide-binding universal stress UspA family protein